MLKQLQGDKLLVMNQLRDCKSDFSRFQRETVSLLSNKIKPNAKLLEEKNISLNNEISQLKTQINDYNKVLGQNRQVHIRQNNC